MTCGTPFMAQANILTARPSPANIVFGAGSHQNALPANGLQCKLLQHQRIARMTICLRVHEPCHGCTG